MRHLVLTVGALALVLSATHAPAATNIGAAYTGPHARGQTRLGQTFTVPATDHVLTQFTLAGVAFIHPASVDLHIAPWSGTAPGTDLYVGTFPADSPFYTPIVANPGPLDLTPGGTYVAYLTSASPDPVNAFVSSGYSGGSTVWYQSNVAGWFPVTGPEADEDLAFTATFEVPEPAGLASVAVAALAPVFRRRRDRSQKR